MYRLKGPLSDGKTVFKTESQHLEAELKRKRGGESSEKKPTRLEGARKSDLDEVPKTGAHSPI